MQEEPKEEQSSSDEDDEQDNKAKSVNDSSRQHPIPSHLSSFVVLHSFFIVNRDPCL